MRPPNRFLPVSFLNAATAVRIPDGVNKSVLPVRSFPAGEAETGVDPPDGPAPVVESADFEEPDAPEAWVPPSGRSVHMRVPASATPATDRPTHIQRRRLWCTATVVDPGRASSGPGATVCPGRLS